MPPVNFCDVELPEVIRDNLAEIINVRCTIDRPHHLGPHKCEYMFQIEGIRDMGVVTIQWSDKMHNLAQLVGR